jgi:regulator of sigma E protease
LAEQAGFREGELIRSINGQAVASWQELRWELLQQALAKGSVTLEVINKRHELAFRKLDLSSLDTSDLEGDILLQTGFRFYRPMLPPVIGKISPEGVADLAGLRDGDRILAIDGVSITSWSQVVAIIREAPGRPLRLDADRQGKTFSLSVTPAEADDRGKRIGRIGIGVREEEVDRTALMTIVRYGPVESLGKAVTQTWETSVFSLKMLGRMITGEVSWKNLSGPVTIADYAGQSAKLGLAYYIKFLALISISLGVLNLLPIPLLDGGHLMYYIVEIIKGGPVSERVMEIGQQIGLALLAMLMAFAFYNDINRLVSG